MVPSESFFASLNLLTVFSKKPTPPLVEPPPLTGGGVNINVPELVFCL
jgi:hypothetical protein